MAITDVFQPVATGPPPKQITARADHPLPKLGIVGIQHGAGNTKWADTRHSLLKTILSPPTNSTPISSSAPKDKEYGRIPIP